MMQKPLFSAVVMLIFMAACKLDRKPGVDRDKFTFRYTDDSFLFFRNVRQIYYDLQDLPGAHWQAFRWTDRTVRMDVPVLNPVIVIDWHRKEAYLLVEANELLMQQEKLTVREINRVTGATYSYTLGERGRENMLEFATKIYEGIMAENTLLIEVNDDYQPLFFNAEHAETFRVVMGDYYRLTNIFTARD